MKTICSRGSILAGILGMCFAFSSHTFAALNEETLKFLDGVGASPQRDNQCQQAIRRLLGNPKTVVFAGPWNAEPSATAYADHGNVAERANVLGYQVEWISKGHVKRAKVKCYLDGDKVSDVAFD